jgi:hypothetical protein
MGLGYGLGDGLGFQIGEGLGAGLGEGLAEGLGDGLGEGLGTGLGDALGEGLGDGLGEGLGDGLGDVQPPKAALAPAIESVEESIARLFPVSLNHTALVMRGNWLPRAAPASMIHWPFVVPGGSPVVGSLLAHSARMMGLVALSETSLL